MIGKKHMSRMALLAAMLLFGALRASAEEVKVTFVLVNDIYEMSTEEPRGGFAKLASVVRAERKAGEHVVYVHAGDMISPSLFSNFDQGAHTIKLTNMESPDLFVPGNHEFDFGPDVFRQRMSELTAQKLGANLRNADGSPLEGFADTKMYEFGPTKIGVVGIAADNTPVKSSPGDLKFEDGFATASAKAAELREAGADLIVVLAHSDRAEDMQLYNSGEFDVILTGDDHDLVYMYNYKTAMIESSEDGEYVTALDLTIDVKVDGDRRSVSWTPDVRIIDTADVEGAPDVLEVVAGYEAELSKELDVALGTTEVEIDTQRASVRSRETVFGNIVADAMRAAVGADVAITNGGGIRGNTVYAPGSEISRKIILTELPFGNKTVLLEVSGADIKAALENGVSDVENGSGRFPHVSGMRFEADLTKPAGERVTAIMVGEAPLDMAATYKLATNDFMGNGGDGYGMFKDKPQLLNIRDTKLMANDVMVYVRDHAPLKGEIEGRIRLKP